MPSSKIKRREFLSTSAAFSASCAFPLSTDRIARAGEQGAPGPDAPQIDCDFPGGNVVLDRIDGDHGKRIRVGG